MKKRLLAAMLCGALLTGCGAAPQQKEQGSGTAGSAQQHPVTDHVDMDELRIGGCESLAFAGNLAAAKAADVSYEDAAVETAFLGNSEQAWQKLMDGSVDVVISYAPDAQTAAELQENGMEWTAIGSDALVFLAGVAQEDTVVDFSKAELQEAYQSEEGDWTCYAAAEGSDSRKLFENLMELSVPAEEDALTVACPHTEGTLCYTTFLTMTANGKPEGTKAVSVNGIRPNLNAPVEPVEGEEEQEQELYELAIPFFAAVNPALDEDSAAKMFYRWIVSDEGKAWLTNAVFDAVPAPIMDTAEES